MNRRIATALIALAVIASACGGGGDDSGTSAAPGGSERPTFASPNLTSAEVCERIGKNDIVALFDGVNAAVQPNDATTGCWYSVNPSGETTITLLNSGGRDAYEYEVERWTTNAARTVTPIEDFTGVNFDGDAVLVGGTQARPHIVMFLGGANVWQVTADEDVVERVARTVAGQVV